MSGAEKVAASKRVSKTLADFLPSLNSKTDIDKDRLLGGFSPLKDELEWYLSLLESDLRPCVPSISDEGSMEFHKVTWKLLTESFLGLTLKETFPLAKPSVLIVPGLAFTKEGARLGRGKGYYDRYLEANDAFKIGICCEWQVVEEINVDGHDIFMDAVVTDQNIYIRGSLNEY